MQCPAAHSPDGFGDDCPEDASTAGVRFDFLENIEGMAAFVAVWSCSSAGCTRVDGGGRSAVPRLTQHTHSLSQLGSDNNGDGNGDQQIPAGGSCDWQCTFLRLGHACFK
jgi:hypothetical protein